MLSKQEQLTELVRLLEAKDHVFATDPLLITEKMQNEGTGNLPSATHSKTALAQKPTLQAQKQKLGWRAERIDADGKLAKTLGKIDARIKGIILVMSILWCISGFAGLFALLQTNVVNFFYVLVCVLGVHTLMLLGWIVLTIVNHGKQKPSIITSFISPKVLIRGKDDVTQSATDLYDAQLQHTGMRWYLSKFSHQLWLATLIGMLFAIIFLLIVRQYSFSWESTLLSDATLLTLTHWLGWLPSMVGFGVPDATAIEQSRLAGEVMPLSIARQWAGLLIGSLLMYGIVPRALAWAFCVWMFARQKMSIDLNLPYYQKILTFWERKVVDADDFVDTVKPVAPVAKVSRSKKLVALLEYPHEDEHWYQFHAGHNIIDFGVLDDRDDMERLLAILEQDAVQVFLGVHVTSLPDRGVMRKLDKLATHAKDGLVVQLLYDTSHPDHAVRAEQWQEALAKRQIGLVS